jgi:endonuclease/exonuclease/phosphatase family metal-dependent hydrolase
MKIKMALCASLMVLSHTASFAESVAVGVASFNMAWAGTEADFTKHLDVCTAVKWCDTRPKIAKGDKEPTPEAKAEAKLCEQAIEEKAVGKAAALLIAPCNAYKTKNPTAFETLAAYKEKLSGLQKTVEGVIEKEGVGVLAFQEVRSKEVVQIALGKYASDFEVCDAPHNGFQTVAFAWNKKITSMSGVCAANQALAVKESLTDATSLRKVRPGLALQLQVNGSPITFMNIHLKSSCASLKTDGGFAGRKLTDTDANCEVLNRQVPKLESWIEAISARSPRFILLGDFNRKIDEEASTQIASNMVRLDGSDPANPNVEDKDGHVTSQYLWQEIADGSPVMHQIPLVSTEPGCTGFQGLDHIVISEPVKAQQGTTSLTSRKVSTYKVAGQKIETSDHCPRVTKLQL